MTTSRFPPMICPQCQANAPNHWLTDFWFYCEHNCVMVRRRVREDQWAIDLGIKPKVAARHLKAAVEKMAAHCKKVGATLEDADQLLTQYRKHLERR